MDLPLVSVIVPVYMVEEYIDKCIISIRNQKYKNIEIIIIDDGSLDGSSKICEKHACEDERITLIKRENKGLSSARNLGIKMSAGSFITFVDGDDWIDSEMIEELVHCIQMNGAQISCCGHIRESKGEIYYFSPKKMTFSGEEATREWLRNENIKMMAWGKLYSRELFLESEFFPENRCYEDTASCWKLFMRSPKVVVTSNCFYHYNIRPNSITNSHSAKNAEDKWYAFYILHESLGCVDDRFEQFTLRLCFMCIESIWRERFKLSVKERAKLKKVLKEMSSFSKFYQNECINSNCNLLTKIIMFLTGIICTFPFHFMR